MSKKYEGCKNLFGPLGPAIKARLEAFFRDPTDATWDDAHTIIIGGDHFTTFWQSVIHIDPTFPRSARLLDPIPDDPPYAIWERIPDEFTARRALEYAKSLTPPAWMMGNEGIDETLR